MATRNRQNQNHIQSDDGEVARSHHVVTLLRVAAAYYKDLGCKTQAIASRERPGENAGNATMRAVDDLLRATADAESRHFWFHGFRAFVTPLVRAALAGRTAPRILDCGCGTGANLDLLGRFGRASGFDLSETGLRIAREAGRTAVARGTVAAAPFRSRHSIWSRRSTCCMPSKRPTSGPPSPNCFACSNREDWRSSTSRRCRCFEGIIRFSSRTPPLHARLASAVARTGGLHHHQADVHERLAVPPGGNRPRVSPVARTVERS